jgi:hypothetical protein
MVSHVWAEALESPLWRMSGFRFATAPTELSALRHTQTYAVQQPMSAFTPIATAKADLR